MKNLAGLAAALAETIRDHFAVEGEGPPPDPGNLAAYVRLVADCRDLQRAIPPRPDQYSGKLTSAERMGYEAIQRLRLTIGAICLHYGVVDADKKRQLRAAGELGWLRKHPQGGETFDFADIPPLEVQLIRALEWATTKLRAPDEAETANTAGDKGLGLDRNNVAVLFCLSNREPALLTLDDIVVAAKVSRDTASKALRGLVDDGLAHRPKGDRRGATVTDKGRATAALIGR